jgi:hypothetical protein
MLDTMWQPRSTDPPSSARLCTQHAFPPTSAHTKHSRNCPAAYLSSTCRSLQGWWRRPAGAPGWWRRPAPPPPSPRSPQACAAGQRGCCGTSRRQAGARPCCARWRLQVPVLSWLCSATGASAPGRGPAGSAPGSCLVALPLAPGPRLLPPSSRRAGRCLGCLLVMEGMPRCCHARVCTLRGERVAEAEAWRPVLLLAAATGLLVLASAPGAAWLVTSARRLPGAHCGSPAAAAAAPLL